MGLGDNLRRDIRFVSGLKRLLKRIKPITLDSTVLLCDDLEEAVERFGDNIALQDEKRSLSYRELDALANRYANWARNRNLKRSDVVALVMQNRVEYVAAWYGFSKLGVATALINNNLTGQALAHCINLSNAFNVVTDEDCWQALEEARPLVGRNLMLWVHGLGDAQETNDRRDLDNAVRSASSVRPDKALRSGLTNRDTVMFIYTSGTTGLPKAARIPHSRARTYMRAFAGAVNAKPTDILYNCLPLYHSTGGLCGTGAMLLNGGKMVIRRRFSATHFWPDVKATQATHFVYIGELCRYLVNSPASDHDRDHRMKHAFGNGLRPDVWREFQGRFGLTNIMEFYGSTEGNVSLFNFDGKAGAIGRVPSWLKGQINIRLIDLDPETGEPVRGPDGLCRQIKVGEIGEAIGRIASDIRHDFSGYADKKASEAKILHDVLQKGDRWFRTGDLMRQDHDGYFYFMDRLGDTYRWKGENVSTAEVELCLHKAPGVQEAIAYGVTVPGQEGRAGMAALVMDGRFNAQTFAAHVQEHLPSYAQPCFVRLLKSATTTGTFKYRKTDLVKQGFDPDLVEGAIYMRGPKGAYRKMTPDQYDSLLNGSLRL